MQQSDLNDVIDRIWPEIAQIRNKTWTIFGSLCALSVAIIAIAGKATTGVLILAFIPFWIAVAAIVIGATAIKKRTKPLGARLREISGYQLDTTPPNLLISPLLAMGVVPTSGTNKVKDALRTQIGPYRLTRLEISAYDTTTNSDGRNRTTMYFGGHVVTIANLPPCPPLTVLFQSRKRGFKRLRKFMKAHATPAMRQEETHKAQGLDEISVFGDGSWDQENVLSPSARATVDVACHIARDICVEGETVAAAHFGANFCAVAIETRQSRFSLGGLLVTKPKLTHNVDQTLSQLGRSFRIAETLIAHATSGQDQSS